MKTHFVQLPRTASGDDEGFLALFIPAIANAYRRIDRGLWCVTSVLSASQIKNRLEHWTAGQVTVSATPQSPMPPAQKRQVWQWGAMIEPLRQTETWSTAV
jgi:hypothetical protein